MPWGDWQFWLVTVLAILGVLRVAWMILRPPRRRCGRSQCLKSELTVEGKAV